MNVEITLRVRRELADRDAQRQQRADVGAGRAFFEGIDAVLWRAKSGSQRAARECASPCVLPSEKPSGWKPPLSVSTAKMWRSLEARAAVA